MKTLFAPDDPYDNHDDLLTLTELKEQANEAQNVGEQIVALTGRQLRRIPLEDGPLRQAVMEARRLTTFAARRRQFQFIGKLMRSVDVEPLRQALADVRSGNAFIDPELQRAKDRVEVLLSGTPADTETFLQESTAERTRLSHLMRQHAKDDKVGKGARARKALLAYVQATQNEAPTPEPQSNSVGNEASAS